MYNNPWDHTGSPTLVCEFLPPRQPARRCHPCAAVGSYGCWFVCPDSFCAGREVVVNRLFELGLDLGPVSGVCVCPPLSVHVRI